jgi:hypothetical protein
MRRELMRKWLRLSFVLLVAVAVFTSAVTLAQRRLPEREYYVISGGDLGFRVEGTDSGATARPLGK